MDHEIALYTNSILDNLKEAFFAIDRNWNVRYWNNQAEAWTGKTKEEVLGKNLWESFPEEVGSIFHEQYELAFQTGSPVHFKNKYEPMNKIFHVSAYPVGDLLSVGFLDISSIENNEAELKKLSLKYKIVTHATTEAVWDWEQKDDKIYWHGDRIKEMLGYDITDNYTPLEFWSETIHPDDRERVIEDFSKAIETGAQRWVQEYRIRKADGEYLNIQNHALLMKENGDTKLRMIGSLINITKQAALEQKLKQDHEATRRLFEYSPLPQWIFSRTTLQFLDVNIAAQNFYGYTREEFLNMTIMDIRPEQEQDMLKKYLKNLSDDEKPACTVVKHKTKSGEIKKVEVHSRTIVFLNESVRMVTIRDLTNEEMMQQALEVERKSKQQDVFKANIKGQEAAKEHIGKELHDNINQILTSTKLYLELVDENEEKHKEVLNKCKRNLDIAIQEIRRLSKSLVVADEKDFNLIELLNEIANTYKLINEFHVSLDLDEKVNSLPNELKVSLFRIVQEQINNITKHANASDVWMNIRINGKLKLEIKDNGKGFDLSQKRLGIGLQNIKKRAEAYGGIVEVESEPGKGFLLKVDIPIEADDN